MDPVLKEVHDAGEALFREVGHDYRKLLERLKRTEQEFADRLSDRKPVPYPTKKMERQAKKRKSRDAK